MQTLGSRALPSRSTALGRALYDWRESLVADLGGPDAISTQQLALVDLAVRSKLLVDSVDAFVLAMPSPVNRQRRCLHPVVRERASLVNQFAGLLRDLGLDRRVASLDIAATFARMHAEAPPAAQEAPAIVEDVGGGGDPDGS